jgi:PadR family transcriptional regulator PadR
MGRRADEQGELLKGNTPTVILAVLEAGALHGYAIAREVERRSAGTLSLGEGSLYPALRALERDGFIASRWEPQPSAPARKVYELTEAGLLELNRRERSWRDFTSAMNDILSGRKPDAQPT